MTKAQEARDRLRARIEAVLRKKGGFEVAPYLEAIAIEQWIYGDPDFLASLIEENTLSPEASTFVAEIVRGRVKQIAEKRQVFVHPGAALFIVTWLVVHQNLKETVAVERAALDLNVSSGQVWDLIQGFEQEDLQTALKAIRSATDDDLQSVMRNVSRPPVFGGMIWTSSSAEI